MSMNELSSTDSSSGAPLTVQPMQTMAKLEMDDKTFLLGTNPKKYADRTHSSESGWESESNASQVKMFNAVFLIMFRLHCVYFLIRLFSRRQPSNTRS